MAHIVILMLDCMEDKSHMPGMAKLFDDFFTFQAIAVLGLALSLWHSGQVL